MPLLLLFCMVCIPFAVKLISDIDGNLKLLNVAVSLLLLCLAHNFMFLAGYSFTGYIADCIVLLTEYASCCLLLHHPLHYARLRNTRFIFIVTSILIAIAYVLVISRQYAYPPANITFSGSLYQVRYNETRAAGNVVTTYSAYKLHFRSLIEHHLSTHVISAPNSHPLGTHMYKFSILNCESAKCLNAIDAQGHHNNWPIEYYHK